jgi:hypothetical protein
MRSRVLGISLAAMLLSGAVAQAEEDEPPGPVPGVGTLDRTHVADRFGLSVGYTRTQATQNGPASASFPATGAYRFELYGQHLTPSGFGGYASVPFVWWRRNGSETAPSNPELGALWVPKRAPVPLVARLGATIDASRAKDALANLFASNARITDSIQSTANVSAARLSASILPRFEGGYLRFDAGLDVPVLEGDGVDAHALVRLNGAAGTQTEEMAFYAEVANLVDLQSGDGQDRFLHTVGFGARLILWKVQPSLTLAFPLDSRTRQYVTLLAVFGIEYVR